jgi:hypothetical protein
MRSAKFEIENGEAFNEVNPIFEINYPSLQRPQFSKRLLLEFKFRRDAKKLLQNCLAKSAKEQSLFVDQYSWSCIWYGGSYADRLVDV